MAFRLRFDAPEEWLERPSEHMLLPMPAEGLAHGYAVCRSPSTCPNAVSIYVTDPRSSRVHCIFSWDAEQRGWGILDRKSTNGTFLNAQKIEPNTWCPLSVGDAVSVGKGSPLRWVVESAAEHSGSAAAAAAAGAAATQQHGANLDASIQKKPRGRPPKGRNGRSKVWSDWAGEWIEDGEGENGEEEDGEEVEVTVIEVAATAVAAPAAAAATSAAPAAEPERLIIGSRRSAPPCAPPPPS